MPYEVLQEVKGDKGMKGDEGMMNALRCPTDGAARWTPAFAGMTGKIK
jgi:hypothetical protein